MSRVEVSILDEGLRAVVRVTKGASSDRMELDEALQHAGVVHGIDDGICDELGGQLSDGGFVCESVTVASGTPPVHGRARYFEPRFEIETIKPGTRFSGKVDFHARSMLKPATAGQTIAWVHPTMKPVDGKTVDGLDIRARPVPEKKPLPRFGDGTACKDDGSVVATRGGIIVYRPGTQLEVESSYSFKNDIDLRCGHLESHGTLEIEGAVKKGFAVAASKRLSVRAIDGGAAYCRANMDVDHGIRTADTAIVSVLGDLRAHHCEHALIECASTMRVEMDVIQSRIHAHELIVGRKIIGGMMRVEHMMTAKQLGSESGAAMVVILADPLERPLECGIRQFSIKAARELGIERRGVSPDAIKKRPRLSREEREAAKRRRVEARDARSRAQNRLLASAYLDVTDIVHPGVTIKIGTARLVVERKIHRARFKLDAERNRVVHCALDIESMCDKRAVAS